MFAVQSIPSIDPATLERLQTTFRKVGRTLNRLMRTLARQWLPIAESAAVEMHQTVVAFQGLRTQVLNSEVPVAGLEARYYVRAGLDPAYATVSAHGRLVASILNGTAEDTAVLSQENRRLVAASALRGWADHHVDPEPTGPVIWHRLIGAATVSVGLAAA